MALPGTISVVLAAGALACAPAALLAIKTSGCAPTVDTRLAFSAFAFEFAAFPFSAFAIAANFAFDSFAHEAPSVDATFAFPFPAVAGTVARAVFAHACVAAFAFRAAPPAAARLAFLTAIR